MLSIEHELKGKSHLYKLFSRQSLRISFHYAAYFSGIHSEYIFKKKTLNSLYFKTPKILLSI